MYDLMAVITVQSEGGNHLLLSVVHLRQFRADQGFLQASWRRIEQGYFFNVSELVHHFHNA